MSTNVLIKTTLGNIKVKLYDETPIHRDNFIKLVKEGFYNGTLFHRVIKNFMIQGGDPDSKKATPTTQLGTGDAGYRLKAEILYPQLFHKRGALAAARQGDEINPNRESSGCQFYIVWGDIYKGGQLAQIEKQMEMMQQKAIFDRLVKENYNTIKSLRLNRDNDGLMALQEELIAKMQQEIKEVGVAKLTNEQKEVYSTIGGTPHLDGQYTVFGEVIDGLDIVEQIQQVATGTADRPKEDIKMEMEIC